MKLDYIQNCLDALFALPSRYIDRGLIQSGRTNESQNWFENLTCERLKSNLIGMNNGLKRKVKIDCDLGVFGTNGDTIGLGFGVPVGTNIRNRMKGSNDVIG